MPHHHTLTTNDTARLHKILALLGSEQGGEVLAAARALHRIVARSGLDWSEIIAVPATDCDDPGPAVDPAWRRDARRAQSFTGLLTPRDADFLASVVLGDRLTPKQKIWLDSILRKIDAPASRRRA